MYSKRGGRRVGFLTSCLRHNMISVDFSVSKMDDFRKFYLEFDCQISYRTPQNLNDNVMEKRLKFQTRLT